MNTVSNCPKPNVGINCVAPGCTSKMGNQQVKFFKFPADAKRFKLWCSNAKRLDLAEQDPETVRERFKLCSNHFEPPMLDPTHHDKLVYNAVPTIFHGTDGVYPCTHCKISFINRTLVRYHEKLCRAKNVANSVGIVDNQPQMKAASVLEVIPKSEPNETNEPLTSSPAEQKVAHVTVKSHMYKCTYCDYSCARKGHLNAHEKVHTGEKPFECFHCDYRSALRGHLKAHLLIHQDVRPFKCDFCHYACLSAGNLRRHLRSHTGEKRFKCDICGYRCSESRNLRDHLMVHSGYKPYTCGECGYKCTQASNMKMHIRAHTGFKPYVCSECGYKCSRAGNMKGHMRTHTGERPFVCPICDYRAVQSSHLKNHMKTHANDVA